MRRQTLLAALICGLLCTSCVVNPVPTPGTAEATSKDRNGGSGTSSSSGGTTYDAATRSDTALLDGGMNGSTDFMDAATGSSGGTSADAGSSADDAVSDPDAVTPTD